MNRIFTPLLSLFVYLFASAQDYHTHVFFANQAEFPITLVPSVSGSADKVEVRKLNFIPYEITHDHSSTIGVGDFIGQPEKDHNEGNSSLMMDRRRSFGNNNYQADLEVRTGEELLFTIKITAQDISGPFVRVHYNVLFPDGSLDVPAPGVLLLDNAGVQARIAREIVFNGEAYKLVYGAFDENQDNSDNIIFSLSKVFDPKYRYDPLISDTLNPNVLNLYCFNPGILKPLNINDQDEDERAEVFYKAMPKNMDVMIFQEFFEPTQVNKMLSDLSPWYPYYTGSHNRILIPNIGKDGGVRIASKYPILEEKQISFSENGCVPTDFFSLFANKGVKYAKIDKKGQILHVFGTHTSLQPCDLYVMGKFIADMNLPKDEVVIMAGDFNVDMNRIKNGSDDYTIMLDTLKAIEPTYLSFTNDRPYWGTTSGLAHMYCCNPDGRQHLDYVFASAVNKVPFLLTNRSQQARLNEPDASFGIFDMGDHQPVYARMEFPALHSNSNASSACLGENISLVTQLEVPAPGGAFQWYKNGLPIDGENSNVLNVSIANSADYGDYTCKYSYDYIPDTSINNFFDPSYMDYNWIFRGVTTAALEQNFKVVPTDSTEDCRGVISSVFGTEWKEGLLYPNPAQTSITLSASNLSSLQTIDIIDATGKVVLEINRPNGGNLLPIDIRKFAPGIYYLRGKTKNAIYSKSFVKL